MSNELSPTMDGTWEFPEINLSAGNLTPFDSHNAIAASLTVLPTPVQRLTIFGVDGNLHISRIALAMAFGVMKSRMSSTFSKLDSIPSMAILRIAPPKCEIRYVKIQYTENSNYS